MRKGFTLTLTTLAVALLTTSVYAYGPTVGGIPDVWITEKDAAGVMDAPQYIFRYSDAMILADYVTPGVQTGNGSTSATLEWTWALRYATFDGGFSFVTGATTVNWLAGTDVHYSITGEDATDVLSNQPTFDVSGNSFSPSTWVSEVNGWSNKANLADSGALTFQNIRLNPTMDGNASPTADTENPQLPSGVLDLQEATIFVTDGATTPGFDMVNLITLMSDATTDRDLLSGGGPVYGMVEDYRTDTGAGWSPINVGLSVANGVAPTVDYGADSVVNNAVGTFTVTFPTANNKGTNTNDPYFPAVLFTKDNVAVTSDKVYRFTARVASSNSDAALNPSVRVDLNGRITVGEGFGELSGNGATQTTSPVNGSPVYLKGFLWPAADGNVQSYVVMWDTTDTVGGTITMDNMLVESFDSALLSGGNVLYDAGTNAASGIATSGANSFISAKLPFYSPDPPPNISMSQTPLTGDALSLSFQGIAGTSDGVGIWGNFSDGQFATPSFTGKKLVIVTAMVKTTSANDAKVPDFHMSVNNVTGSAASGNERAGFFIDRYFVNDVKQNEDADVSNTARAYSVILEAKPSTAYQIALYALVADSDSTDGNLTVERVTATMYDLPAESVTLP